MTKKSGYRRVLGPKALEMVMRDVLGGMEEIVIMKSLDTAHLFEIVAIECGDKDPGNDTSWDISDSSNQGGPVDRKVISLNTFRTDRTLSGN